MFVIGREVMGNSPSKLLSCVRARVTECFVGFLCQLKYTVRLLVIRSARLLTDQGVVQSPHCNPIKNKVLYLGKQEISLIKLTTMLFLWNPMVGVCPWGCPWNNESFLLVLIKHLHLYLSSPAKCCIGEPHLWIGAQGESGGHNTFKICRMRGLGVR